MLQLGLACATFLVVAFAPPAVGRTLLVPIAGEPIGKQLLDQAALTRLGPGPLPGSVVVEGRGRALASSLFDRGIIMLAAPAAICGEAQEVERNG